MINKLTILCCLIVFIGACKNPISSKKSDVVVDASDDNCTEETLALLRNLVKYQDSAIMFGHQDDLAYGINWWAEDFRSDVFDVSGSYPAVFGWDLGKIGSERNLDSVSFSDM
jgi:mannan endo-1,4-beta-mannosidase